MTLNIMLTSKWALYLTGDFRLTYEDGSFRDDHDVQKLVPVFRMKWSALVSFCGIAKTETGLDVGDWLVGQIDQLALDSDLDDLLDALTAADKWLADVGGGHDRRLTFAVVAFDGDRPAAHVISNWQDFDGPLSSGIGRMAVASRRPRSPAMFATGSQAAIQTEERLRLVKVLASESDIQAVHGALAEVSEAAAKRDGAGTISLECVTGHLIKTGRAEVIPHGIADDAEYMPSFVRRELAKSIQGFRLKPAPAGGLLPPRWVGMTATVDTRGGAMVLLHAIRNVEEPPIASGPVPPDAYVLALPASGSA